LCRRSWRRADPVRQLGVGLGELPRVLPRKPLVHALSAENRWYCQREGGVGAVGEVCGRGEVGGQLPLCGDCRELRLVAVVLAKGRPHTTIGGWVWVNCREFCPASRLYMRSLRKISGITVRIRRWIPRLRRKIAGIRAAGSCSGRTSSAASFGRNFEIA
jgi:hypothetical protein